MRTIQKRPNHAWRLAVPTVTIGVLVYFGMHAQTGQYGIHAREQLARELDVRRAVLDDATRQRERLQRRVKLLRDGTLERDMLDERARRALNVANEDEIVILR